jgi:hypothetical protein
VQPARNSLAAYQEAGLPGTPQLGTRVVFSRLRAVLLRTLERSLATQIAGSVPPNDQICAPTFMITKDISTTQNGGGRGVPEECRHPVKQHDDSSAVAPSVQQHGSGRPVPVTTNITASSRASS